MAQTTWHVPFAAAGDAVSGGRVVIFGASIARQAIVP